MIRTNEDRLVKVSVQGQITPPMHKPGPYVDREGRPFILPGTGGISYNLKVGDPAFGWVGDHLEPGVSVAAVIDNRIDPKNKAFNMLSCIGNTARVVSGDAKGAEGIVTGHHGGIEHVLIDFADEDLEKMAIEDKILVKAFGQGLELLDYPGIKVFNLDPALLKKLNITEEGGQLKVGVVASVPARLMGSGIGSPDVSSGDYDITTADQQEIESLGLDELRLGDLVALEDCDNRYGRAFRKGALSIGVVIHSDCLLAGHGPGVSTIFTAIDGSLGYLIDPGANVAKYLGIGSCRQ